METECGHIPCIQNAFTVYFHTKRMGRVINNFQAILVGYLLNTHGITGLPIYMNRHNGRCSGCNGSLYLIRIHITCRRVDIHEDRSNTIPPKGMGGSHKTIRGGYHLSRYSQSLQSCYQWQCSIGEKTDKRYFQISSQFLFQLLMKRTIVCYPLARPNFLEHCVKIVKVRQ